MECEADMFRRLNRSHINQIRTTKLPTFFILTKSVLYSF